MTKTNYERDDRMLAGYAATWDPFAAVCDRMRDRAMGSSTFADAYARHTSDLSGVRVEWWFADESESDYVDMILASGDEYGVLVYPA